MFNLGKFRQQSAQRSRSGSASVAAPVGGWNARDPLGAMDPLDAVSLVNIFPTASDVTLRKGYVEWATGLTDPVQTLMVYDAGGSQEMYAITDAGDIYDVTSDGAVGAAVHTGLSNGKWQYVNVATAGGHYLYLVNGVDKPLLFDGTTWTEIDGASTPKISSVTTTTLANITLHKSRVWFTTTDTLVAWYLPTNALGDTGTTGNLDMRTVARRGGSIVALGTWTVDAGYGVDDLLVFVTSEGEVLVYRGTDPSSSTTWALVGVWQIGAPIGRRCLAKFAGDLLIICHDGLYPMSGALQSSRVNPKVALSDKIQVAMSEAISQYGDNFGWESFYYPRSNMLMLNVPVQEGNLQEQYVMNTITKAWCRFQGWNANCWELYNDDPYFGGDGVVYQAWYGAQDNGAQITGTAIQAFNYYKMPSRLKRATMIRPIFSTDGEPTIYAALNFDFDTSAPNASISVTDSPAGIWDTSKWDAALWGGDFRISKYWQGVTGIGYSLAPAVTIVANGSSVHWISTDIVMESGAIL